MIGEHFNGIAYLIPGIIRTSSYIKSAVYIIGEINLLWCKLNIECGGVLFGTVRANVVYESLVTLT